MFETVIWFLISCIVVVVSVLLWRKSIFDKKLIWLLVTAAMCLIMAFGVGPCFKAELVGITVGVFVFFLVELCCLRLIFVSELKRTKNRQITISTINKATNVLIGGFWFAFAFALAVLYL